MERLVLISMAVIALVAADIVAARDTGEWSDDSKTGNEAPADSKFETIRSEESEDNSAHTDSFSIELKSKDNNWHIEGEPNAQSICHHRPELCGNEKDM